VDFKGKTAIVTGAGRGIGKVIAMNLAKNGANIVINDIPSSEDADITARQINEEGGIATVYKCDVRRLEDVEKLVKYTVDKFSSIDILINNAGIARDKLILRMKEEDWDDVISVNLKGAFNCIKAVARTMIKQRSGSIVNVSSVIGVMGNIGQANYSASKAGLIGLTKSTAKELAARGITCNAIAPGFISSDMTSKLPDNIKEEYLKSIPLGRLGTPDDVANAISFLVSKNANYITGQVLHIDGGLIM
jgi:3-oxoacyl-[acyl-carrier protein] reductase